MKTSYSLPLPMRPAGFLLPALAALALASCAAPPSPPPPPSSQLQAPLPPPMPAPRPAAPAQSKDAPPSPRAQPDPSPAPASPAIEEKSESTGNFEGSDPPIDYQRCVVTLVKAFNYSFETASEKCKSDAPAAP
jgi:hypothetical protein